MSLNLLQEVQMPIGDESYCQRRNSFKYHKFTDRMYVLVTLTDHHLLVAAMLIVVVHYNVKSSLLCNGLDRFTDFTRTSKYVDWIKRQN